MRKKYMFTIFGTVVTVTVFLVILGFIFNKSENEKQNGLTNIYDVSIEDIIAFITYEEGKPGLYLYQEGESSQAIQLPNDKKILDVSFSKDGSKLAFLSGNKDPETKPSSTVHLLDMNTRESTELFTEKTRITEIQFDPKDDPLFYLRAGTYENYSSIASERPHEFDIYNYQLTDHQHDRMTNLESYSMSSLKISSGKNTAFVQMDDNSQVETPEDSFETNQRIFEIPLNKPDHYSIASNPDREVDIFDFALVPKKDQFIYQSISKTGADGIFQYELYQYDTSTNEEEQLTYLGEHASKPIHHSDDQSIYFMMDKQFAGKNSDFHLYKTDINGENTEEIPLLNE